MNLHKIMQKNSHFSILLVAFLGFSGCSQTPEKTVPPSTHSSVIPPTPSKPPEPVKIEGTADMSPQTMYRIMLAEMLVQKKQHNAAFGVLYPIAQQTKDVGLAKRAFQLSMSTYDVSAIKAASELWRGVEPDQATPWKASYMVSIREKRVVEAVGFWQQYLELSGEEFQPVIFEAASNVVQSAPAASGIDFMQRLQALYPKQPASSYALGSAAEVYGEYDLAIKALDNAAGIYELQLGNNEFLLADKMYRETHHLLATVYLKADQPKQGLDRLAGYVEDFPADWEMQEHYARLEVRAGYFKAAEERYLNVMANEPTAHTSKLSVALLQMERRSYDSAQAYLVDLQSIDRYRNTATYYLGLSEQEQGNLAVAKTHFKGVVGPDYLVDAQLHLAEIEYTEAGLNETLALLDKVKPKNTQEQVKLYRAKAIFYGLSDKKADAVDMYYKAIELNQKQINLYLSQAVLLYDLERFEEYEKNLKYALSLDGSDVDALNALGYFYVEQERNYDEAKEMLDKALALSPNVYYVLDSRGWLAFKTGQYDEAEAYLSKALGIQMDAEVLMHLIETKWALNKREDAQGLWLENHAKFPDNSRLQNILLKLQAQ